MTDRQARALAEMQHVLEMMERAHYLGSEAPSRTGLLSTAIAHTRQALLLLQPMWLEVRPGLYMPRSDA